MNPQGLCSAASLYAQRPHGFSDLGDFLQHEGVYEAFRGNTVEVDYLVDYMTSRNIAPRAIYREVRTLCGEPVCL